MAWICCFSACPVPVTDFLIRFGVYSATRSPSLAGASRTTPRAWPSFSVERWVLVDEGFLDGGLGAA